MKKDVIVIGGGPAGLTTALYAQRAGRKVLLLERLAVGGQMLESFEINNYPGIPQTSGSKLAEAMQKQAEAAGVEIETAEVTGLQKANNSFLVQTDEGEKTAKSVVVCTGLSVRRMEVPGEAELVGRGVSFCTTCDAPLMSGKIVGVYGGGNSALSSVLELARICQKVYLIYRGENLRADQALIRQVQKLENVEFLLKSPIQRVLGKDKLTGIEINRQILGENELTSAETNNQVLNLDGLFVQIGRVAKTDWCGDLVERTEEGTIIADSQGRTKTEGLFVAGDIKTKEVRQIATAVGDGAVVGRAINDFLSQ